jgi:hypothetical protein
LHGVQNGVGLKVSNSGDFLKGNVGFGAGFTVFSESDDFSFFVEGAFFFSFTFTFFSFSFSGGFFFGFSGISFFSFTFFTFTFRDFGDFENFEFGEFINTGFLEFGGTVGDVFNGMGELPTGQIGRGLEGKAEVLFSIQLLFAIIGESDGFVLGVNGHRVNSSSQNSVFLFVVQIHMVW